MNELKTLLMEVVNGDVTSIKIPFTPICEIESILEELGVDIEEPDNSTNGWQVDFWNKYDGKYMLSGGLYYGNFKFEKL